MGVCYTHTDDGRLMRKLSPVLRARILKDHYRPHHARLAQAVQHALEQHGRATIVDCHSFPGSPLQRDLDQAPERPDYNIGTEDIHTPAHLVDAACAYFQQLGHSVVVDRPYSGSMVPLEQYHREARVRSIMLEVNRDLYLHPGTALRNARYDGTKAVVRGFLDLMRAIMDEGLAR